MIKYGASYQTIIERLSKITNINAQEINEIMEAYAKKDYQFAKKFYDYRGIDYIPYEKFTLLKNQVDAIGNITNQAYINMVKTSTLGFTLETAKGKFKFLNLKDSYNYAIDQALLSITHGKDTFDNQMQNILKQFGNGVKTIDYASGKTRRLDSAVRMLLMDGTRQLHNATQEILGNSFGADGIEISVHENPAIDHQDLQGRQFTIDEFNKLQRDEEAIDYKNIPHPSGHRPISQFNCYHTVFYIVLGVNQPQYTNEQLEAIKTRNNKGFDFDGKHYTMYEGTQLQRRLETEIRKQKDTQIIGKEANNKLVVMEAQYKITQLTNKYKRLSQASGLSMKNDRLRVAEYHRTATGYKKVKL